MHANEFEKEQQQGSIKQQPAIGESDQFILEQVPRRRRRGPLWAGRRQSHSSSPIMNVAKHNNDDHESECRMVTVSSGVLFFVDACRYVPYVAGKHLVESQEAHSHHRSALRNQCPLWVSSIHVILAPPGHSSDSNAVRSGGFLYLLRIHAERRKRRCGN
jgi:hypothetical protein